MKMLIIGSMLIISGCSTIRNGSKATFHILSEHKDAKVYYNGDLVGEGGATVSTKVKGDHVFRVEVDDKMCKPTEVKVEKRFDANTLWMVPIDLGITTVGVDILLTGAAFQPKQTHFLINPDCPKRSMASE